MTEELFKKLEIEYEHIYIPYIIAYLNSRVDREFNIELWDIDEIDNNEEYDYVYYLLSDIETITKNGKKCLIHGDNNGMLINEYVVVYEENFYGDLLRETRNIISCSNSKNSEILLNNALNILLSYSDIFLYNQMTFENDGNVYSFYSEGYDIEVNNYNFLIFKKNE